ncbi:response regulator [Polaromonas sp. P2-4]|nr:response regulator [Polaromonas sp. P2-4]
MPLIVVMEDDADIRTLMVYLLNHEGYDVLAADNGSKGLELIESHRPDLIISDIQMPGMTGFQVLEAVRQNPAIASTPLILLTALHERTHMRHGMTAGADDYITKPFEPSELSGAVYAQLNRRVLQTARQDEAVSTAVKAALDEQQKKLTKLYEQRLFKELGDSWPTAPGSATDEKFEHATVLFVDMANYSTLAEQLSGAEFSELVKSFTAALAIPFTFSAPATCSFSAKACWRFCREQRHPVGQPWPARQPGRTGAGRFSAPHTPLFADPFS